MNRETSDRLRAALHSQGWRGERSWQCPCGGHENGDAKKSLSITENPDATLVVNCHVGGGDRFREILAGFGISSTVATAPRPSTGGAAARRAREQTLRDFGPLVDELRARSPGDLAKWAESLGVRSDSLARFGALVVTRADLERHRFGFDGGELPDEALAWPEYDGAGSVCGIAARATDGRKGTAKGSKRGIARPLVAFDSSKPIYCTEGVSDAWALDTLGLQAFARPNNSIRGILETWLAAYVSAHAGPLLFALDRKAGEKSIPLVEALATKLLRPIRYSFAPDDAADCREWVKARIAGGLDVGSDDERTLAGREFAHAIESNASTALAPEAPEGWRRFPVEALPDPLQAFVVEQAQALGVDVAFVAVAAVVVVAAAIGNSRGLRIKRDWREPSILWTMIVAESGSMKGPAVRPAIEPLLEEDRRLYAEYERKLEQHRQEIIKSKSRKRSGGTPDATLPPFPRCERRIVSDTTVEALAETLRASPRGLLMFAEEGAAWFASFGEYKKDRGGDGARWCCLYDAVPLIIDRKGSSLPSIRIQRGAASVLAAIQPGILAARWDADAVDSGLLPRCSFVMPPVRPATWTDAEVSRHTRERFAALVLQLAQLPESADLELDEAARAAFVAFVNEHAEIGQLLTGFDAARHSKTKGLAGRLALVLALARDPGTKLVTAPDVTAGIALARWFEAETGRVVALLKAGAEERAIQRLVEWIAARGGSISLRDYQRLAPSRAARRSAEAAKVDLDRLVSRALAVWRRVETGGRPSELLELVTADAATCDKGDEGDRRSEEPPSKNGGQGLSSPSSPSSHVAEIGGAGLASQDEPHADAANAADADGDEIVDFGGDP